MAERYLWSPLRLGPVTVRNRIVFSAHLTNYAVDGRPTEQHAAYYEARAAGGAGLIITEEHSTHPTDWPYEKLIHGFHRDVIPGYRRITEAVHRHGTPIFAQINHNGGQASSMYSRLPVWAPSPVADPLFREVPKAVDEARDRRDRRRLRAVAEHCAEGGFDGIELQCSHSSIVRGFLSPATNRRTDGYGGPLENRARLLLELVAAVRARHRPGLALGVRLCGDELIEGGTTIDEAVRGRRLVEATGHVDYINTSIGVATATLFMIEASMHVPPGYALFIPSAIRKAVDLPVVGVGRFKDPLQAERALAEGHCDLVGSSGARSPTPTSPPRPAPAATDEIRLCLSCNQECVGRMGLNRWLGCIENPRTGREAGGSRWRRHGSAGPEGRDGRRRRAGRAAGRHRRRPARPPRHRVRAGRRSPGGQVRLAATVPNRAEFGDLVRNQLTGAARLGVAIEYGVGVWPGFVAERTPDAVIVATGAGRPGRGGCRPRRATWSTSATCSMARPTPRARRGDRRDRLPPRPRRWPSCSPTAAATSRSSRMAWSSARISASRSTWRAGGCAPTAKGIVQVHRPRADGHGRAARCSSCTTRPASMQTANAGLGRAGRARPARSSGSITTSKAAGVEVDRVGDCVAPRRAHAAVVEGERAGAAL